MILGCWHFPAPSCLCGANMPSYCNEEDAETQPFAPRDCEDAARPSFRCRSRLSAVMVPGSVGQATYTSHLADCQRGNALLTAFHASKPQSSVTGTPPSIAERVAISGATRSPSRIPPRGRKRRVRRSLHALEHLDRPARRSPRRAAGSGRRGSGRGSSGQSRRQGDAEASPAATNRPSGRGSPAAIASPCANEAWRPRRLAAGRPTRKEVESPWPRPSTAPSING